MRVNDAVFGAVLAALAVAIALVARGFADMPGQDYGPALFPTIIAAGFGLCGLALLARGLPRLAAEGAFGLGAWKGGRSRIADVALIVLGLVAWIALWDRVGFVLGATAYGGAVMTRFRGRPLSSFALALALAVALDWSFRRGLLVPLPLGPLTGVVW